MGALLHTGARGWGDVIEAQFWVIVAHVTLRRVRVGNLVCGNRSRGFHAVRPEPRLKGPDLDNARAIARAIDRVARLGLTRPLCLARSLALHRMLERRGYSGSAVRVGVNMGAGGLEAHAWVEWDGHVLGDLPDNTTRYRRLDDLVVNAGGGATGQTRSIPDRAEAEDARK